MTTKKLDGDEGGNTRVITSTMDGDGGGNTRVTKSEMDSVVGLCLKKKRLTSKNVSLSILDILDWRVIVHGRRIDYPSS